jgi:hypothetical protein
MPVTQGLSFYQDDATTTAAITYGFNALSPDDITVIAIASNDTKTLLVVDVDYTLNLTNKTVTCLQAAWTSLSTVYASSSIRVYRTTSVLPLIDFKSGAVLSEGDLDMAYKQGLFAAQEMTEDAADTSAGLQSVTTGVIAPGAVTGTEIADNSVDTQHLVNNSVGTTQLIPGSINSFHLQSNSISTISLALGAVTPDEIAADAVTTVKILDDNVTQAKVAKASAANMLGQSATDGVVTPDVLKYSPFSPRCYGTVSYDGNATVSTGVNNNYNVGSASQPIANQIAVTFATNLSSADYVVVASMLSVTSSTASFRVHSQSTSGFIIQGHGTNEGAGRFANFVVFGSSLSA